MAWAEVCLNIPRELADLAEAVLEESGALAITLQDSADNPVLEPPPGATPLWPGIRMRGLFSADVYRGQVSAALMKLPGIDRPEMLEWRHVEDQVWERVWMDRFQPMKFGRHLWIVPTGMQAPEDDRALVLHLDPGLAFGTGTHPTTALCLQWIDGHDFQGEDVVDFGCGSGVLGIASALKGARRVVCVDNDPQALEASTDNAARNGVSDRVVCISPQDYAGYTVDVVLANILSQPLIELAPILQDSLRPGGQLVLSGVLSEQAEGVARAYRNNCGELELKVLDEWVRLHGRKLESGDRIER